MFQYLQKIQSDKHGFGIVDIIVALAIIGLIFFSIYEFLVVSTQLSYSRAKKIEASQLAQEGIEAVRVLKNTSWTDNISGLTPETNYYLIFANNTWSLTTTPVPLLNSLFTRTLVFSDVARDADDDISPTGTDDPDTKKLTVTVSWPERGQTKTYLLETYLTNFLDN